MVHLVPDEGMDDGPVLTTEIIPIHPGDTLETLEARAHETEHNILINTLRTLLQVNIH